MNPEIKAKAIAYKAYQLGRLACTNNITFQYSEKANNCLNMLEKLKPDTVNLQRRLFYTLFLAELNRELDCIPFRQQAHRIQEILNKENFPNAFKYYIEIINSTGTTLNSGHFGDFGSENNEKFKYSEKHYNIYKGYVYEDRALKALNLNQDCIPNWEKFINTSFENIVTAHIREYKTYPD